MLLKLAQLDGSGQALAVGQWQSLCLEGLADERYPIRLSALSQLSSLAESAEASLTPVRGPKPPPRSRCHLGLHSSLEMPARSLCRQEEFTAWVTEQGVLRSVFGAPTAAC